MVPASSRRSSGTRRWRIATEWLAPLRASDPRQLAFFTGRDQSQALTGFWAAQFGTPNFAAHGGFCSVNMAAAGMYTIGGSFWEFGEPDWERARYLLLFGVAEDHDSNPIKLGLAKLKERGAKIVSVNPVRTGYSAIADEWLRHRARHRWAAGLRADPRVAARRQGRRRLSAAMDQCRLAGDRRAGHRRGRAVRPRCRRPPAGLRPGDRTAGRRGDVEDRSRSRASSRWPTGDGACPSFELAGAALSRSGLRAGRRRGTDRHPRRHHPADRRRDRRRRRSIEPIVVEQPWTDAWGRRHERIERPGVAMHAMRGVSAHANGFHTCRALHLLQILLGTDRCARRLALQGALSAADPAGAQARRQAGADGARPAARRHAARLSRPGPTT